MNGKYIVVDGDGNRREVTEDEWQSVADRQLAAFNGGVPPKTDSERKAAIENLKRFRDTGLITPVSHRKEID